jgi:hypothetical protein
MMAGAGGQLLERSIADRVVGAHQDLTGTTPLRIISSAPQPPVLAIALNIGIIIVVFRTSSLIISFTIFRSTVDFRLILLLL